METAAMGFAATVDSLLGNADYFILLLLRVSGLVIPSPIFGRVNIPARAKICLALALSFLFFFLFPGRPVAEYSTLFGFFLVCAGELLLGVTLAFVTNIFFTLMFTAGQLIDMQIGFGIVNVFDIQNNTQIPMMGNILNILLIIVFFAVDGHLKLIHTIVLTVERIPIGTLIFSPATGVAAFEVFIRAFLLGVMVAMPVVACGLTMQIILGVAMRMVPQIHMFVIGIPLKMIIGMFVFMASLPIYVNFSEVIFSEMFNSVEIMFAQFVA